MFLGRVCGLVWNEGGPWLWSSGGPYNFRLRTKLLPLGKSISLATEMLVKSFNMKAASHRP